MINALTYRSKWWALLAAVFVAGSTVGFFARERAFPSERLLGQSSPLTRIACDAMLYRATPKRLAQRIETELQTPVIPFHGETQNTEIIVVPAETGLFGMGGRWIMNIQTGKDGRCDKAWLELQPVGYL